jgi:hypothetical protein
LIAQWEFGYLTAEAPRTLRGEFEIETLRTLRLCGEKEFRYLTAEVLRGEKIE